MKDTVGLFYKWKLLAERFWLHAFGMDDSQARRKDLVFYHIDFSCGALAKLMDVVAV